MQKYIDILNNILDYNKKPVGISINKENDFYIISFPKIVTNNSSWQIFVKTKEKIKNLKDVISIDKREIITDDDHVIGTLYSVKTSVNGKNTIFKSVDYTTKNIGKKNQSCGITTALIAANKKYSDKLNSVLSKEDIDKDNIDSRSINPMLASIYSEKSFNKLKSINTYVQPKLDGVRCLMHINIENENIVLYSRGHKIYEMPKITEYVKSKFKELRSIINKGIIIDGELYKHGTRLQKISGLARLGLSEKYKESSGKNNDKDILEYHIYDIVSELNFDERLQRIEEIKEILCKDKNSPIKKVPTDNVKSINDIKDLFEKYLKNGYEGVIVRYNGPYEQGKRSKFLQKLKPEIDEEFVIVGFKKDNNGGILWEVDNGHGSTFDVKPDGKIDENIKMFKRQSKKFTAKGKLLTIKYNGYKTEDNNPMNAVAKSIRDYE